MGTTTRQKNIRLTQETIAILRATREVVGISDTKIIELAVAAHALSIGVEVRRARDFLYHNLLATLHTAAIHAPRTTHQTATRRKREA